ETIGVSHDPRGQHAAAAAYADEEVLVVNEALRQRGVNSGHQVVVILAGIRILDAVDEILAVTGRASRVGVEHGVTVGREVLERPIPRDRIHRPRAAVNPQHHRIFLARLKIGGFYQPTPKPSSLPRPLPRVLAL